MATVTFRPTRDREATSIWYPGGEDPGPEPEVCAYRDLESQPYTNIDNLRLNPVNSQLSTRAILLSETKLRMFLLVAESTTTNGATTLEFDKYTLGSRVENYSTNIGQGSIVETTASTFITVEGDALCVRRSAPTDYIILNPDTSTRFRLTAAQFGSAIGPPGLGHGYRLADGTLFSPRLTFSVANHFTRISPTGVVSNQAIPELAAFFSSVQAASGYFIINHRYCLVKLAPRAGWADYGFLIYTVSGTYTNRAGTRSGFSFIRFNSDSSAYEVKTSKIFTFDELPASSALQIWWNKDSSRTTIEDIVVEIRRQDLGPGIISYFKVNIDTGDSEEAFQFVPGEVETTCGLLEYAPGTYYLPSAYTDETIVVAPRIYPPADGTELDQFLVIAWGIKYTLNFETKEFSVELDCDGMLTPILNSYPCTGTFLGTATFPLGQKKYLGIETTAVLGYGPADVVTLIDFSISPPCDP